MSVLWLYDWMIQQTEHDFKTSSLTLTMSWLPSVTVTPTQETTRQWTLVSCVVLLLHTMIVLILANALSKSTNQTSVLSSWNCLTVNMRMFLDHEFANMSHMCEYMLPACNITRNLRQEVTWKVARKSQSPFILLSSHLSPVICSNIHVPPS